MDTNLVFQFIALNTLAREDKNLKLKPSFPKHFLGSLET